MLKVALTGKISDFLKKVTEMPEYLTFDPKDIINRDMQIWMEENENFVLNIKVVNLKESKVELDICTVNRNNMIGVPVSIEVVTVHIEKGLVSSWELLDDIYDSLDNKEVLQHLYDFYSHILIFMFFDKQYSSLMDLNDNEILVLDAREDEIKIELIKKQ